MTHRGPVVKDGGYLLSHKCCSTIGAIGLNFSVRNGKRWIPNAITTLIFSIIIRLFLYRLEEEKRIEMKTVVIINKDTFLFSCDYFIENTHSTNLNRQVLYTIP